VSQYYANAKWVVGELYLSTCSLLSTLDAPARNLRAQVRPILFVLV